MSITKRLLGTANTRIYASLEDMDVSLEEEVIAASAAEKELNEGAAESEEIDRLSGVAAQTAQTVDYIEQQVNAPAAAGETEGATQNEVALAEQVANLATAGTGDDAETIMPSSESYIGGTISTEGFKEQVRGIVKAVIEAIKRLWERLKRFWKHTMSRLSSLKRDAKDIAERGKKATGTAKDKKISISGTLAGNLSIGGVVKKTGPEIMAGLKALETRIEHTNDFLGDVATAGEDIADAIKDVDPEKAAADEAAFAAKFATIGGKMITKIRMTTTQDTRYKENDWSAFESDNLLGDVRLFSRKRSSSAQVNNTRQWGSLRYTLDSYAPKVKEHSDVEIPTLTTTQISDLAEQIVDMCDQMAYYADGKGSTKIEKARKDIESALNKIQSGSDSDEVTTDNSAALRRMISLGHAFCNWATNPAAPLVNHTCTIARSVLTVCTKSLAKY